MGGSKQPSTGRRLRKRVEADSSDASQPSIPALKRARDGSAFVKCDECKKDVPVALITFHSCILDAKIKNSLEAQVIDIPCEPKKASEKRKPKSGEPNPKKRLKKANNQSTRKRPPTAFFVFMEDFRKEFKEANPGCKSVAQAAKEGGEKWKSMSDEEKKVYNDRAADLKADYEKATEADNAEDEEPIDVDDDGHEDDKAEDANDDDGHEDDKAENVDEKKKSEDNDAETTVKKEDDDDDE